MKEKIILPVGGQAGLRLGLQAMGTRFELYIADEGDQAEFRAIGEEALACIEDWHNRLSAFDRGSVISILNSSAGSGAVRVDRDMLGFMLACQAWHLETNGAFDIAIGSLMQHHGFRDSTVAGTDLPAFGMKWIEIDKAKSAVSITHPEVRVDCGAIAKGWALDEAATILRDSGIRSAVLHGGTSTAVAIGAQPNGEPWRIRIASDEHAPVVDRVNSAISVSAPSGRVNEEDAGHVIDPRIGNPAQNSAHAAVLAKDAAATDAWSTALVVLGERPASMPKEYGSILLDKTDSWITTEGQQQ